MPGDRLFADDRTPAWRPVARAGARRGAACLLLASLYAARAAAQPVPDLTALSLEELAGIDVSAASFLPGNLLDAGSSIAPIGPKDWQRHGARRLLDALETQPGVLVLPHTSGNEVLAIRGYARSTSYTGVATSWDGVPLNDLFRSAPQFNMPTINLGALNQIQLIQGPGSALYGSDAFRGLVALRGYEADHDTRQVGASIGSDGYYESAFQLGQSLGQGARMSVALAANGQPDQDRQVHYTSPVTGADAVNTRANHYDAETLSLKLSGDPAAPLSWYGGVYLHHYAADGFQGLGTRLSGAEDLGGLLTHFGMAQGGLRARLSATGSLEWKVYYWSVDNDLSSNLQLASGPVHRDLQSDQYRGGTQAIYRDAVPAWHTEWALALGDEWLGVTGAKAEVRAPGQVLVTTLNRAEGAHRNVRSATFEANTSWDEQRWRLIYGARLDEYSDFGRHASPRLGLIFHPAPDSAVKLLYGQAFRAPSAVEIGGAQGSVQGNPNLQPELIDSYELVAMRQGPQLTVQATLFRTLWHDGISAVFDPVARFTQYQNVDRNDAKGASASLAWHGDGWQVDSAASYVISRNDRSGVVYNIFPRWMWNGGVGHALFDGACQLSVSERLMSAIDDIPSTEGFQPHRLPRFARTDLSVTREFSRSLTGTLQVRNLFNRDNRLPSPPASIGGIPDARLSLNATMHYRF